MSLKELEKRIAVLEDLEAIKKLKAQYARLVDEHNTEDLAKLFTEDGVWDSPNLGRYEGRKAIKEFFDKAPETLFFTVHHFTQPYIEIDSESNAHGRWNMWCPASAAGIGDIWVCGVEEEKYEKIGGRWLISEMIVKPFFSAPYVKGWGKKKEG